MQNQENTASEDSLNTEPIQSETDIKTENTDEKNYLDKISVLETEKNELNDKYLRLYSDFDNYRKRNLKERSEIIKTASEDVFKSILPVIDDFERAVRANEAIDDSSTIKEGLNLIFNKLKNITAQKGLIALESTGEVFNADIMEAITHIAASDDAQKGKVVDEIEKGYKLGDKVIRFAKVIVAQ